MTSYVSLDNRCRICAAELSDLTCSIPIFGDSSASFCLQSKISKFLYITVLEDDMLPKKICATCFLKIESIDKFALSALKNQECFSSWLQNNQKNNSDHTQTTIIETSTNPDFGFSNITIKKEFNQRQQIVFQPQKTRNPRHVDHITLEQIINTQIIKNPKLPASTTITKIDEPKKQKRQSQKSESSNNISIVSYHNLQIGQLIKDYELLKLILRALKWEEYDRKASYDELIERLRRSNCRDILTNKNLLSDNDVVQLLRSYVNDSMLVNLKVTNTQTTPHQNISKIFQPSPVLLISPAAQPQTRVKSTSSVPMPQSDSASNSEAMEVSVDPDVFLADDDLITIEDDEETVSAAEAKIETAKLQICDASEDCEPGKKPPVEKKVSFSDEQQTTEKITSSSRREEKSSIVLQDPAVTDSAPAETSTKPTASAIVKPSKTKKAREMLRSKRKKIIIRINPSPSKRNVRERTKVSTKFTCAICNKSLSSKRNVQLHEDTHKEKGKFRCDSVGCKKLFGKIDNLIKHRQLHEKPVRRRKNCNEK